MPVAVGQGASVQVSVNSARQTQAGNTRRLHEFRHRGQKGPCLHKGMKIERHFASAYAAIESVLCGARHCKHSSPSCPALLASRRRVAAPPRTLLATSAAPLLNEYVEEELPSPEGTRPKVVSARNEGLPPLGKRVIQLSVQHVHLT
mmetsp:Transcript_14255/g.32375  ORF Transcript_14255/g.32375 Transcript_14255/m.32375 type:complete len:147 (+) Transcript_14255:385-825(+)